jgi:hypothetical protein
MSSSDDDHVSIELQDSDGSLGKEKFNSTNTFSDENV